MSVLRTTDDLRADALFRAGEPPTDTTGSFWDKALEYMNVIQQRLLLGGAVSAGRDLATSAGIYAHLVDLPITDWWWARKRAVFNTRPRLQRTVSGSLTQGTTQTVTVTSALTEDIEGWYVCVLGKNTVYRAVSNVAPASTSVYLDAPYVDDTVAAPTIDIAKLEYELAPDFLRFCSTPYIHSVFGASIDVSSLEQRNTDWPLAIIRQGRPTRAFQISPRLIALNGYDTRPYRVEYEYIAAPAELSASQYPMLPVHHRSILSVGAAMMILFDRGDGRAANLASEYRELLGRMVQEHRRALSGGSSTFGQFRFRKQGTPVRSPQSLGELYLV